MSERPATQAHTLSRDAWRRWEMDSFQPPEPPPSLAAPDPADAPQVALRLQALEQQARQRGREAGYAEGHAEGLAAGKAAGAEEGRQSGHAQGRTEGYEAGYAEGQARAREEADALRTLASTFAGTLSRIEEDLGQGLVGLAIGIAEQVIRDTIAVRPESLLPVVREIVQLHGDSDAALVIHAHPDDHALLQRYLADDASVKRWRLIPDTHVERGGCTAHTALGSIDATLPTRWRRAVAALGHPATLPPQPPC